VPADLAALADEAGLSQGLAGVQYPGDVRAGLALARAAGGIAFKRGGA
jgi:hypothetical protein